MHENALNLKEEPPPLPHVFTGTSFEYLIRQKLKNKKKSAKPVFNVKGEGGKCSGFYQTRGTKMPRFGSQVMVQGFYYAYSVLCICEIRHKHFYTAWNAVGRH